MAGTAGFDPDGLAALVVPRAEQVRVLDPLSGQKRLHCWRRSVPMSYASAAKTPDCWSPESAVSGTRPEPEPGSPSRLS